MTAKEYLDSKEPNTFVVPEEFLIEFAQYHVTQALKKATEEAEMTYESFDKSWWIDEDSILNAYPKELIK